MCYQTCNAHHNCCSFCEFLRDLFTPVNSYCGYYNGNNSRQNSGCVQAVSERNGCLYGCARRCPCCGAVLTANANGNGCAGVVATQTTETTLDQTRFGCCQRRRQSGCYYANYDI